MRVSISVKIFAAAVVFALPSHASAQCGPPDDDAPAVRESLLVTTAWLAAHQRDPDLVIVHVEHMRGMGAVEHIPGARKADAMQFTVGSFDLAAVPVLDSLIESLGISNSSRVVLYGDPWVTGFIFTVLDYLGHQRTAVLDGGLEQWRVERRPVTAQFAPVTRTTYTPRVRSDIVADAAWLRSKLRDPRTVILDNRTAEEYAGTAREDLPRTGHIPGAILVPWLSTFEQPANADQMRASRLKSSRELRALLRDAGVRGHVTPVAYCTVGMRASHMYFVLKYLGYDPRFYDGSMSDWSRRSELPVATGTSRGAP